MIRLDHNSRAIGILEGFTAAGRIPQALLVEAPRGCGKKTFARLAAQSALCRGGHKPCGVCPDCIKAEKGIHPDIRFFGVPDGKKEFPVDQVRTIRQEAYIAPNEGVFKIYVLDQAQAMNAAAQNALLKLIEEPPDFVRFILLCENRAMMLPTILSRAASIELARPTPGQCLETLERLVPDTDDGVRRAAAAGADGNIGIALELLDTAKPSKAAADAKALRDALIGAERYQSVRILAGYDKERDGLARMLDLLEEHFSGLALSRYRGHTSEENEKYRNRVTDRQALMAAKAVAHAAQRVRRNVGIPLVCACMVEDVKAALGQ